MEINKAILLGKTETRKKQIPKFLAIAYSVFLLAGIGMLYLQGR